jgi:hypothetical protein
VPLGAHIKTTKTIDRDASDLALRDLDFTSLSLRLVFQ